MSVRPYWQKINEGTEYLSLICATILSGHHPHWAVGLYFPYLDLWTNAVLQGLLVSPNALASLNASWALAFLTPYLHNLCNAFRFLFCSLSLLLPSVERFSFGANSWHSYLAKLFSWNVLTSSNALEGSVKVQWPITQLWGNIKA